MIEDINKELGSEWHLVKLDRDDWGWFAHAARRSRSLELPQCDMGYKHTMLQGRGDSPDKAIRDLIARAKA